MSMKPQLCIPSIHKHPPYLELALLLAPPLVVAPPLPRLAGLGLSSSSESERILVLLLAPGL